MVDGERSRAFAPLNDWDTIAAGLRAEGLIRDGSRSVSIAQSPWMRIAAAVVIALGGVAVGRYSARQPTPQETATAASPQPQLASNEQPSTTSGAAEFSSTDEAWKVLNRAGEEYQRASAYLAANNSVEKTRTDSVPVYQSRLAALDQVMQATHSALNRAPNDPMINQYYLATMGAREATRQQLQAVRTVGAKLKGF